MIVLDNIHKAFGDNQVLRGFSLEVSEGETVCIIGFSGAGKSVAIKHIVGLLEPDAGRVIVDDKDVQQLTFESYMNKELVRRKPMAHVRIFLKDMAHLLGLARA